MEFIKTILNSLNALKVIKDFGIRALLVMSLLITYCGLLFYCVATNKVQFLGIINDKLAYMLSLGIAFYFGQTVNKTEK